LSLEALRRDLDGVEVSRSVGATRLYGAGVEEHAAPLASTGSFMVNLQKLVSAIGASLRGHRSARGPLPTAISALTRMNLSAAPGQGSIIFSLDSAVDPADERYPAGQIDLVESSGGEPDELLLERSIREVGRLLSTAGSSDPDAIGALLELHGPKVAEAARALADTLWTARFDLDLSWSPPGRARVQASIRPADARFLSEVVEGRELDAEPVTIRGVLRTATTAQKIIHIEVDDGDLIPVNRNEIPIPRNLYQAPVVADVLEKVRALPDGRSRVTRRLRSIALDDTLA
jgi:hypothetical protein